MKKQIPLVILELIQPIVNNNSDLIQQNINDQVIIDLTDNDEHSDFFFKIVRQEMSNGFPGYILEFKPKSNNETSIEKIWVKLEVINNYINKWLEIISAYNEIKTIYDDPIIRANQIRFEEQFKIIEEDANYSSFNVDQQIFLDDYLNSAKTKIERLKIGKSEEESFKLSQLIEDANAIQKDLTTQSKNIVITKLSKFWAKAQKIGLDVIKEIFVQVISDLTKNLLKG